MARKMQKAGSDFNYYATVGAVALSLMLAFAMNKKH
jgi:hypothetical protein